MKSIAANGTELYYDDRGAGSPLLLMHGFPLDHSMWADLRLDGDAVFRLIAPDLRGFGNSPARGETTSMELFADDLAGLLDSLEIDEPSVVCGLSMGGYVALQFWRKHRRRLRALIFCDTRAAADSPRCRRGAGRDDRTSIERRLGRAGRNDVAQPVGRGDQAA